jgi:hypothetical protein
MVKMSMSALRRSGKWAKLGLAAGALAGICGCGVESAAGAASAARSSAQAAKAAAAQLDAAKAGIEQGRRAEVEARSRLDADVSAAAGDSPQDLAK